jgi:hypothetical protein
MIDQLEIELKLYHDCYTLGRAYKMNHETADSEAMLCLQCFMANAPQYTDPRQLAGDLTAAFEEYCQQW